MRAPDLQIVTVQPGFGLAVLGNVIIGISKEGFDNAAVLAVLRKSLEFVVRCPRIVILSISEPGCPIADRNLRAGIAAIVRENQARLAAYAIVPEDPGLKGQLLRAVSSALLAIIRPNYPAKIFETVETATQWIAESVPAEHHDFGNVSTLRAATEKLRRAIAEHETKSVAGAA